MLNIKTFLGGVDPHEVENKWTAGIPIEEMPVPERVVIPLSQHIGAPCKPLVKVGDEVKVGQRIGESQGFVSVPVHASISGTVKKIQEAPHVLGTKVLSVIIESDGQDTLSEEIAAKGDLDSLSGEEIKKLIQQAGIAGMGGAAFPTHVKLSPPDGKSFDTVILNGCECEPYLTADHRLMLERPADIIHGLKAILKVTGAKRALIAIETNKPDALKTMEDAAPEGIEVAPVKTKYPQGSEKQLIQALTGREVPSGGLPVDVGVLVQNVGTACAISDALRHGLPLIKRVVAVTGSGVKEPKNLLVRIGTSFKELIEYCGGYTDETVKIISGGPMMGIAQNTDEVPVIKGTSGVLVLAGKEAYKAPEMPCIRCARCVDSCPSRLMPTTLADLAENNLIDDALDYHVMDCIECGTCTFVCPANRPLVQQIRLGKAKAAKILKGK